MKRETRRGGWFALAWVLGFGTALPTLTAAAEFDCVIEPQQTLELRSPLEGLIERVNVDRGDFVTVGQELAVLDTAVNRVEAAAAKHRSEMQGAIQSGESRVAFSAKKSRRARELHEKKFIAEELADEAVTEERLAAAELRDALDSRRLAELEYQRQLEIIRLKTIRSPIDGVVTERVLNPGELAESGVGREPLLKLAAIDPLYVEVVIPVEFYGQVRPGSMVEVTPEIATESGYRAAVKVVDHVLDAPSGTFGVRLELPNPQHMIPAGIRCRANFPDLDVELAGQARSASALRPPLDQTR